MVVGERFLRTIDIVLPHGEYSPSNLDKLFRLYSRKYADEKWMVIQVYTDNEKYEECQRKKEIQQVLICVADPAIPPLYAAHFLKAEDEEYYEYSPDPEKRLEVEKVVLKGKS